MWTPHSRAEVGDFGAGQALSDERHQLTTLAMIRLMLHRLAHPNQKRLSAP